MSTSAPEASAASRTDAGWSGKALIGVACAIVALVTPAPFNLLAAVFAVSAGLLARRDLRQDPRLRGTVASLLAFLLGSVVLVVGVFPVVLSFFLTGF